jgi:hypothetical protein
MAKPAALKLDLPDAWSCFERTVDVVAKGPPQHRVMHIYCASPVAWRPTRSRADA